MDKRSLIIDRVQNVLGGALYFASLRVQKGQEPVKQKPKGNRKRD
jgi:hypothetical protein